MKVISTKEEHINEVLQLYKDASINLKLQGVDQWQNNYPNELSLKNDMLHNESYVIIENNKVIATCSISLKEEITYSNIEGTWLNNEPYIVFHRITSSHKYKGCTVNFIEYTKKQFPHIHNIKIDTHIDNNVMQGWLNKHQFIFTGIITLSDKTKRNAYQLTY